LIEGFSSAEDQIRQFKSGERDRAMENKGFRIFNIVAVVLLLFMLGAGEAHAQLFPIAEGAAISSANSGISGAAGSAGNGVTSPTGLQPLLEAIGTILDFGRASG